MKFAIRDDDTNYFTKSEELENVYANIWNKCPISLSVVPFHTGTKTGAIPKEYWKSDKMFPIGENKTLVEFLRAKIREGKISVMLHGYSHKDNPDGYEFDTGKNLYEKMREGREYLEKIFSVEIKTFVPPHNTLSKDGFNAVIGNNLNIVNVPSFRLSKRPFNFSNIIPFFKQRYYHCIWKRNYPYVLRFSNHSELACHGLVPTTKLESLMDNFDFCYRHNGDFVLATHHWEFFKTEKMRKTFDKFWEYVNKFNDVEFVSVNEIFDEMR